MENYTYTVIYNIITNIIYMNLYNAHFRNDYCSLALEKKNINILGAFTNALITLKICHSKRAHLSLSCCI